MNKLSSIVLCSAAAIGIAAPAMAASADYYLVIDGVSGEASSGAAVSKWSFGASQPATNTSGASGKAGKTGKPNMGSSPQNGAVAAREAQSGMATGRVAAGDLNGDGAVDFDEAGTADEVGPLSLTLPAGSEAAKQLCAGTTSRTHSGHIVKADGTVYDLDGVNAVCSGSEGAAVTVALTGKIRRISEFRGHVTLMK